MSEFIVEQTNAESISNLLKDGVNFEPYITSTEIGSSADSSIWLAKKSVENFGASGKSIPKDSIVRVYQMIGDQQGRVSVAKHDTENQLTLNEILQKKDQISSYAVVVSWRLTLTVSKVGDKERNVPDGPVQDLSDWKDDKIGDDGIKLQFRVNVYDSMKRLLESVVGMPNFDPVDPSCPTTASTNSFYPSSAITVSKDWKKVEGDRQLSIRFKATVKQAARGLAAKLLVDGSKVGPEHLKLAMNEKAVEDLESMTDAMIADVIKTEMHKGGEVFLPTVVAEGSLYPAMNANMLASQREAFAQNIVSIEGLDDASRGMNLQKGATEDYSDNSEFMKKRDAKMTGWDAMLSIMNDALVNGDALVMKQEILQQLDVQQKELVTKIGGLHEETYRRLRDFNSQKGERKYTEHMMKIDKHLEQLSKLREILTFFREKMVVLGDEVDLLLKFNFEVNLPNVSKKKLLKWSRIQLIASIFQFLVTDPVLRAVVGLHKDQQKNLNERDFNQKVVPRLAALISGYCPLNLWGGAGKTDSELAKEEANGIPEDESKYCYHDKIKDPQIDSLIPKELVALLDLAGHSDNKDFKLIKKYAYEYITQEPVSAVPPHLRALVYMVSGAKSCQDEKPISSFDAKQFNDLNIAGVLSTDSNFLSTEDISEGAELIALARHVIHDLLMSLFKQSPGLNFGRKVIDVDVVGCDGSHSGVCEDTISDVSNMDSDGDHSSTIGLVVPYKGVDTPATTEFGYHYEAVCKHMMTALDKGIDKATLEFMHANFLKIAVLQDKASPTGRGYKEAVHGRAWYKMTGEELKSGKETTINQLRSNVNKKQSFTVPKREAVAAQFPMTPLNPVSSVDLPRFMVALRNAKEELDSQQNSLMVYELKSDVQTAYKKNFKQGSKVQFVLKTSRLVDTPPMAEEKPESPEKESSLKSWLRGIFHDFTYSTTNLNEFQNKLTSSFCEGCEFPRSDLRKLQFVYVQERDANEYGTTNFNEQRVVNNVLFDEAFATAKEERADLALTAVRDFKKMLQEKREINFKKFHRTLKDTDRYKQNLIAIQRLFDPDNSEKLSAREYSEQVEAMKTPEAQSLSYKRWLEDEQFSDVARLRTFKLRTALIEAIKVASKSQETEKVIEIKTEKKDDGAGGESYFVTDEGIKDFEEIHKLNADKVFVKEESFLDYDEPVDQDNFKKECNSYANRLNIETGTCGRVLKFYPEYYTANAQRPPSMVKDYAGMTGTPWNEKGYSDRVGSVDVDAGANGKIVQTILSRKKTTFTLELDKEFPTNSATDGVELLIRNFREARTPQDTDPRSDSESEPNFLPTAILDAGAFFKSYSFKDVASAYLRVACNKGWDIGIERKNKKLIKYVIYHDKKGDAATADDLAYLKLKNPDLNTKHDCDDVEETPIFFENSKRETVLDAVKRTDEYVVFYDERHCTGVDVPLDQKTVAVLTFDSTLILRRLLQTVMRLRQFTLGQRSHYVMPKGLKKEVLHIASEESDGAVADSTPATVAHLVRFAMLNEDIARRMSFLSSQKQKIDGVFENVLEMTMRGTNEVAVRKLDPLGKIGEMGSYCQVNIVDFLQGRVQDNPLEQFFSRKNWQRAALQLKEYAANKLDVFKSKLQGHEKSPDSELQRIRVALYPKVEEIKGFNKKIRELKRKQMGRSICPLEMQKTKFGCDALDYETNQWEDLLLSDSFKELRLAFEESTKGPVNTHMVVQDVFIAELDAGRGEILATANSLKEFEKAGHNKASTWVSRAVSSKVTPLDVQTYVDTMQISAEHLTPGDVLKILALKKDPGGMEERWKQVNPKWQENVSEDEADERVKDIVDQLQKTGSTIDDFQAYLLDKDIDLKRF